MEHETLIVETVGSVARITLNRPEAYNAYDLKMGRELQEVMELCAREESISAVILTGSGRAFCSGGDVRAMAKALERGRERTVAFFQDLTRYLHTTIVEMRRMEKPILAAINGATAGAGFGLAMACDLRLASKDARFTQAYTRLGLVPDGGSSFFLPRFLGSGKAGELMFLNPVLDAEEALRVGLVSRVVEKEELAEKAMEMAQALARGPKKAYALLKRLLHATWQKELEGQLEEERRAILGLCSSPDFQEGVRAFLEKREPRFSSSP